MKLFDATYILAHARSIEHELDKLVVEMSASQKLIYTRRVGSNWQADLHVVAETPNGCATLVDTTATMAMREFWHKVQSAAFDRQTKRQDSIRKELAELLHD